MPYSSQHKRTKQRIAQRKRRSKLRLCMCPCSLCLNRVELSSRDISYHVKTFGVAQTTSTSAISVDECGSSLPDTISVTNDTSAEKVRYLNLHTDDEGESSTQEMIASDHEGNVCANLHSVNADKIPIELTDHEDNSSLNLNSEVSLVD